MLKFSVISYDEFEYNFCTITTFDVQSGDWNGTTSIKLGIFNRYIG